MKLASLFSLLLLAAAPLLHAEVPALPAAADAVVSAATDDTSATLSEVIRFKMAADYSARHGGFSLLMMRDGQVVHEAYRGANGAPQGRELASGTKSFAGAMALVAEADGLLSLDEKVSKTITEWNADPAKKDITLRQLLTLTSGIEGGEIGRAPTYKQSLETKVTAEAGKKFQYGPAPFQIFGEVMRRKLESRNQSPLDYLKERVFAPIGLEVENWRNDPDGNPLMPQGASLKAAEWAKFGELIRNGGAWEGKQILPAESLAAALKGTEANPHYGLTFWLGVTNPEDLAAKEGTTAEEAGSSGAVLAAGLGKQRLYILPEQKLVIVRQGRLNFRTFNDRAFFSLLEKGVLPEGYSEEAPRDDRGNGRGRPDRFGGMADATPEERVTRVLERLDADKDGKLSAAELEGNPMGRFLGRADQDADGSITKEELSSSMETMMEEMRARRAEREANGEDDSRFRRRRNEEQSEEAPAPSE